MDAKMEEAFQSAKRRDRSFSPSENPGPAKKPRQDEQSTAEATKAVPSGPGKKKTKRSKRALGKLIHPEEGTPDDVLWHEIRQTLGDAVVDDAIAREVDLESPLKFGDILELDVEKLSSNGVYTLLKPTDTDLFAGESISKLPEPYPPWVVVTPFALPGEARLTVAIKAFTHLIYREYA
jgi:tRNA (uracil-5-)-methyltransferase